MLQYIKKLFGITPKETAVEVPYKVETPVTSAVSAVAEQASQAVVESIVPAKKAPAAKKTTAKKAPAAKKPRSPKAPK
jgi:hypothetical protein